MTLVVVTSLLTNWRRDQDCERYRRIATGGGIPNATSLTELTNSEIKERALSIVAKMRILERTYGDGQRAVQQRRDRGEITKEQASAQIGGIWTQCGREFQDNLRADMELTLWELRNRRAASRHWNGHRCGLLLEHSRRALAGTRAPREAAP
jgi:hypothetical protein